MPVPYPIRRPAHARRRSTLAQPSSFPIQIMPRRSSTWSARVMSIRASAIRPWRFWKKEWPHSNRGSERLPPRAARQHFIWRWQPWRAPVRISSPRVPSTAARTICCTTRCHGSASKPPSSSRETSMPGAPRCVPIPACSSVKPSAIRGWTCSIFPALQKSPTVIGCRCWSTRPSPHRG